MNESQVPFRAEKLELQTRLGHVHTRLQIQICSDLEGASLIDEVVDKLLRSILAILCPPLSQAGVLRTSFKVVACMTAMSP